MVMAEISASMVKELRERSGAAMMDCKRALVEASGDFEKAWEWLRQKGVATASKKASRTAIEGLVVGQVSSDQRVGVIAEVNCETDFVARNPEYVALTKEIVQTALNAKTETVDKLLAQKVQGGTVADLMTEKVAKLGENMIIRRVDCFELKSPHGVVGLYLHSLGGKIGALLEMQASGPAPASDMASIAKDVAMHVVHAKPVYIGKEEVPADVVENEHRIESGKADLAGKPEQIRAKIVEGRVEKLMAERCLLEQPFVKDSAVTVRQYLKQRGDAMGGIELRPTRFALYILGEVSDDCKNGAVE